MEKKAWYCAKELVVLDGIPNTPQAINFIARRDGWKSRKRLGVQGRAIEYEFSTLPQFIQEKILHKIKQTGLEQIAEIYPKSPELPLHRTLQSPKPAYIENQIDLLEIWMSVFQQADITERYKIINFITQKGLGYLIAMINKEMVNEFKKGEYHYKSLKRENNNPNNHLKNCHQPTSQSE